MHDGDGTALDTNNMQVGHDGSTTGGWVGYFQDAPADGFTITARIGSKGIFSSTSNFRFGIFIADDLDGAPSTSDLYSMHIHHISGAVPTGDFSQWQAADWTDYNSIGGNTTTAASPYPGNQGWVRLRYAPSTTFVEAGFSYDGVHWHELARNAALGFTASHIGFGMQKDASGDHTVQFDNFVVASGVHRQSLAGYGRHVPVIISVG